MLMGCVYSISSLSLASPYKQAALPTQLCFSPVKSFINTGKEELVPIYATYKNQNNTHLDQYYI